MWENLDESVFHFINEKLSNPVFDTVFPVLTDLHKIKWVAFGLFPLLLFMFVWRAGKKALKVIVLASLAVGFSDLTAGKFIKPYVQRLRPPLSGISIKIRTENFGTYSFPSNHAANNFAAAVIVASVFPKYAVVAIGMAAFVALTRVYVGVHYPSDVLGGALLGTFFALFLLWGWKRLAKRFSWAKV